MSGRGRTRWGWYRLDNEFAVALVEPSGVGAGDLVLDLGAGDGAITRLLEARGARVIAFELHPRRAAALVAAFAGTSDVKVVRADIKDMRLPRRPFHVVANPPFDAVSQVLSQLTRERSALTTASLVLPVAVASRWHDRLATRRPRWSLTVTSRLPRSAFTPRPRVDCCIARIDRRIGT